MQCIVSGLTPQPIHCVRLFSQLAPTRSLQWDLSTAELLLSGTVESLYNRTSLQRNLPTVDRSILDALRPQNGMGVPQNGVILSSGGQLNQKALSDVC